MFDPSDRLANHCVLVGRFFYKRVIRICGKHVVFEGVTHDYCIGIAR